MDELAVMFLSLSTAVALLGLLAFWDRPSHTWWSSLVVVSTCALLAVWAGRAFWQAIP